MNKTKKKKEKKLFFYAMVRLLCEVMCIQRDILIEARIFVNLFRVVEIDAGCLGVELKG